MRNERTVPSTDEPRPHGCEKIKRLRKQVRQFGELKEQLQGQERSLNVPWQTPIALASGSGVGIFQVVDGDRETIDRRSTGVSTFGAQVMPDGLLMVRGGTMTASTLVSTDAERPEPT